MDKCNNDKKNFGAQNADLARINGYIYSPSNRLVTCRHNYFSKNAYIWQWKECHIVLKWDTPETSADNDHVRFGSTDLDAI